jgi:tRNA/tmRNA/rRNA uracil-C5-methylase (TrmA/RlmC/RlmD family)
VPPSAREIDLEILAPAHGGWCVGREEGGRVVFVRHTLPGERVRAVVSDTTSKFARAEAVEILRASPDRVTPPCPYARPGGCGGCDWQHVSLPAQRALKAEVIGHQLRRIAGIDFPVQVEPLPGDSDGLDWRTRVRYTVGPDGQAGLLAHRSHRVVAIGDCLIAHPAVRTVGVTGDRWDGIAEVEVIVSPSSGERVAVLTPARDRRRGPSTGQAQDGHTASAARTLAGRVDSVLAVRRGGRLSAEAGRSYLSERAVGRTWRVSAAAFWQVHPGAADVLARAVTDALDPARGDVVLDLYCGAGLFAGALAPAVGAAGAVIGIESDQAAVRDARQNLRSTPWARVHWGDVGVLLREPGFSEAGLAVLDPPRTGAGRTVIDSLLRPSHTSGQRRGGPLRRVAYVSCDPATLARDLAIFADRGWVLKSFRAFDAFPMTHHVECLAVLDPP